jgi:hypothetical protein
VPESVRKELRFVFCERVEDVLAEALGLQASEAALRAAS